MNKIMLSDDGKDVEVYASDGKKRTSMEVTDHLLFAIVSKLEEIRASNIDIQTEVEFLRDDVKQIKKTYNRQGILR